MISYLQDFIVQHQELAGNSHGEILADFGKPHGHSHSLGLKIPSGDKNWSFSGGPSDNGADVVEREW